MTGVNRTLRGSGLWGLKHLKSGRRFHWTHQDPRPVLRPHRMAGALGCSIGRRELEARRFRNARRRNPTLSIRRLAGQLCRLAL